jgi:hypothetical protein
MPAADDEGDNPHAWVKSELAEPVSSDWHGEGEEEEVDPPIVLKEEEVIISDDDADVGEKLTSISVAPSKTRPSPSQSAGAEEAEAEHTVVIEGESKGIGSKETR